MWCNHCAIHTHDYELLSEIIWNLRFLFKDSPPQELTSEKSKVNFFSRTHSWGVLFFRQSSTADSLPPLMLFLYISVAPTGPSCWGQCIYWPWFQTDQKKKHKTKHKTLLDPADTSPYSHLSTLSYRNIRWGPGAKRQQWSILHKEYHTQTSTQTRIYKLKGHGQTT